MINPFVGNNPEAEYEYYKERCIQFDKTINKIEDILIKYAFLNEENFIEQHTCAFWKEIDKALI